MNKLNERNKTSELIFETLNQAYQMVNFVGNCCLHNQRIHQNDKKECVGNYDNDNILKFKRVVRRWVFLIRDPT